MADYSQVNDYSAKDALSTGNPLKLIKGTDVDAEFAALVTAISSKFDSTDIATAGEAQAGVSNTVVITPARLTAYSQNAGGVLEDIWALADPGADRIGFWDDSANDFTWLTISTGLSITGTDLTVDETGFTVDMIAGLGLTGGGVISEDRTFAIDWSNLSVVVPTPSDFLVFYDASGLTSDAAATIANVNAVFTLAALSDYDANDHIDHTAVVLTLSEGLQWSSGGTDISASATAKLDISGLTEETTLDPANDDVVFYDNSAGLHRKVNINALVGSALGDGKWYRGSSVQSLTADTIATIVYNTAEYDALEKGTFSTSTGEYTVGASATRVLVSAAMQITAQGEGEDMYIQIEVNGSNKGRRNMAYTEGLGASTKNIGATVALNLSASDVVRVRAFNSNNGRDIAIGTALTYVSIVEIG